MAVETVLEADVIAANKSSLMNLNEVIRPSADN